MAINLPPFVDATLQAAFMGALSNVLAQYIESLKVGEELEIDYIPVFRFVLFAVLTTPINFFFQSWLEATFPSRPAGSHPKKSDDKPKGEPKLSVRNTIIKLVLDQTVSATFNTLAFSMYTRGLQAAMHHAPRETSITGAIRFWNSPGSIKFDEVDWAGVWRVACDEFWGIYVDGLKVWPAVAVVNFTVVKDVQTRNLVGGMAGIAWGTYMSMLANA